MALRPRSVVRIVVLAVATIVGSFAIPGRALAVITCGTPVPASFVLTSDLACNGTDGIVVGADDVVVDLGGHKLSSTSVSAGSGVDTNGHTGVVVRNGEISGFAQGVSVDGSKDVVEGIWAHDAGETGIEVTGSGQTITGNKVSVPTSNGIYSTAVKSSITRNLAAGNATGIQLLGDACCVVDGNTAVDDNTGFLRFNGTAKIAFTHNVALRNRSNGFLFYSPPGKVVGNIAIDNTDNGFYDASPAGTVFTFTDNVAQGNGFGDGLPGEGLGFRLVSGAKAKSNIAANNDDPNNCDPTSACAGPPLAPETPPACGSSIMHSTLLSASKSCSGSHGYFIGADNVVLDLGGHQLGLSGGGNYAGIVVEGHKGVTIRNGEITGFNNDVSAGGLNTKKLTVEGVTADGASNAGFFTDSADVTFIGDVARDDAVGFLAQNGGKASFLRSAALTNTQSGFNTTPGVQATLDGDVAGPNVTATSGNGLYGFDIDSDKAVVTHDIAIDSFSNGFDLDSTSGEKLTDDVAFDNGGDGFNVSAPKPFALTDDVAVRNGFQGGIDDNLGRGFELNSGPSPKDKGVIATLNDDPTNCSSQMSC